MTGQWSNRWLAIFAVLLGVIYFLVAVVFLAERLLLEKRIPDDQGIAQALERFTGWDWEIEELDVEWRGLNPVISYKKIAAFEKTKQSQTQEGVSTNTDLAILRSENAEIYVDLTMTLFSGSPRLYGARVGSSTLRLSKVTGSWSLAGLQKAGSSHLSFSVTHFFNHLQYLALNDLTVYLEHASKPDITEVNHAVAIHTIPAINLQMSRQKEVRHILAHQRVEKGTASSDPSHGLLLKAEYVSKRFTQDASWVAYLSSREEGVGAVLEALYPDWVFERFVGEVWARKKQDKTLIAAISLTELELAQNKKSLSDALENKPEDLNEEALKRSITLNDLQFDVAGDLLQSVGLSWEPFPLGLDNNTVIVPAGYAQQIKTSSNDNEWVVDLDSLDIGQASQAVVSSGILPGFYEEIVQTLNLTGVANRVAITVPLANPAQFTLTALLDKLSADPWSGAPGGKGVSGALEVSARGGKVDLQSDTTIELYFPNLYQEVFEFGSVSGQVSWEIFDQRYYIYGEDLQLTDTNGQSDYAASFYVNGRYRGDEASHMQLEVGVSNAHIKPLVKYIPYTVPQSLTDWVAGSDVSGTVSQGGFIYNGSLRAAESDRRNIQAFFDVSDTSLYYEKQWPKVEAVDASIFISESKSRVEMNTAETSALSLSNGNVVINTDNNNQNIQVDLDAVGDAGDVIRFLQHSPAGDKLKPTIDSWSAKGELQSTHVALTAPLENIDQSNVVVDITGALNAVALAMPNFDLSVEELTGPVSYSSKAGLLSDGLKAKFWGRPIDFALGKTDDESLQQSDDFILSGNTTVDVHKLAAWLELPILGFAKGETEVDLLLEINDKDSKLLVNSSLAGVSMDIPEPFYKVANTTLPLSLEWFLDRENQPMSIGLKRTGALKLAFDQYNFKGGTLLIEDNPSLLDIFKQRNFSELVVKQLFQKEQLLLTGQLDFFNLTEWQTALKKYEKLKKQAPDSSGGDEVQLVGHQIILHQAVLFDYLIKEMVIGFSDVDQHTVFNVESQLLKGLIKIPLDINSSLLSATNQASEEHFPDALSNGQWLPMVPDLTGNAERIILDLDYLRLPSKDLLGTKDKPLGVSDSMLMPSDLHSMKLAIEQLYIGEKPFGEWSFLLTASDNAALIHALKAKTHSLELTSDIDDGLLWGVDPSGAISSTMELRVSSGNFDEFLTFVQAEGDELPMTSEGMNAALSLNWPAAPDEFDIAVLGGDVSFEFDRGRFFQASQSATSLLKILGLVNFDTLVRRIQLDFSDVYKEGLSFDKINGGLSIANNRVMFSDSPIEVTAPASHYSLTGSIDLNDSSIDAELVATLPVASNLPWIAALAGGLPVAAGTFVVTKVFGTQFKKLSTAVYQIEGSLDDPKVNFDRLFNSAPASEKKRTEESGVVENSQ